MKNNIFINKYVMACAISIVIALVGFICMNSLPVEQYPNIAPPQVMVMTSYTGADANTIMKSVIQPLEESINGVPNMTYMTSKATSTGNVSISVFFEQGTDPDMAVVNVQNCVSKAEAQLPADVTKVGVTVQKMQNNILRILALRSTDGKYDDDFVSNYADINIVPRLKRITGVGDVTALGNTYALRIWMKPDVMAQYGLEPNDVFMAISNQSFVASTGSLGEQSQNKYQYSMEYKGTLKSVEEFNDIVLKTTDGGHLLRLSDVAEVEIGAQSYSFVSDINGAPGTMIMIFQSPGANATEVNARITKMCEEVKAIMPAGLEFITMMTSDDFLFAAIHNVVETLIIAIILVILVVFFFLQSFKATVIPSISIVVSLLGTFAVVSLAGFSLNILTLFALVLAIGTVVDDAIVVVEAVMGKIEAGITDAKEATRQAMADVSVAVISCTLVFMAVFVPVTFMGGTSGTFFTQFGVTIASAVGLSCVSAMTLCPALCAIMLRATDGKKEGKNLTYYTKKAYEASYNAIFKKYSKSVQKIIKRPALAWGLLVLAAVLLVFFMKNLPSGLVPQEDQGVFIAEIRAPEGYTLQQTSDLVKQVEEKVKEIPELESYALSCGYGLISGHGSSFATLVVRLKNWDDRPGMNHLIDLVIGRFYYACMDIKDAKVLPFQLPQIPGYGTSNNVSLIVQDPTDGNLSEFAAQTDKFLAKLTERPEISSAMSTYSERYPKYKVDVDATQCDRAGVSAKTVLSTLGSYCGGAYIGNFNQFGKVYRIMACATPESRLDPSSLQNIFVKVKGGKMAPLSEFVSLKEIVGPSNIEHFNLFQSITTSVTVANGYSEGQAHQAIEEVFRKEMPNTATYEYSGMSREVEESANSNTTTLIYCICVILIYLILASLYNSWFTPMAVLLSVPFGLMGAFIMAYLCSLVSLPGSDNNIYLQTGVIMLIGLLSKTAILITEFASERRAQGMSIKDAAFEACKERLRPILMTVVTMIVGMIPLIIEGGAGANGNRALAMGVVGGMSVGTIALLFVVPAFFIVFQKLHERFQGKQVVEVKNVAAVAVACFLLSSCGLYDKYEQKVETPADAFGKTLVSDVSTEGASLAQLSWREFFTDPNLQQLIEQVLENNADLNSARIAVEKSEASLKMAKLAYLPSLYFAPQGTLASFDKSAFSKTYSLPLQLSWDVDVFGSITNKKRAAKAVLLQAQLSEEAIRSNLVSAVAQQYFYLLLLDRQMDILTQTDSLWNASLDTQKSLYENGKAYSTAVNQLESSYLSVKTQLVDVRCSIKATENALCKLLGITPQHIARSHWLAASEYHTSSANQRMFDNRYLRIGVPAQMLEYRPDIRMANAAMEEAFYNTQAARAAFFPSITLTAQGGWTNSAGGMVIDPAKVFLNLVGSLTQPIFAQGKIKANYKINQLTEENLQKKYVQTVIDAGNQVNEAMADCEAAREKHEYYHRQVEVLHEAYTGTHELMDNGKASYLEVLTAQENLLSAQLSEASNMYKGAQAIIALYIALGGGTK